MSTVGFDYAHDYSYDYSNTLINQKIIVPGETPAGFRLIVYGSCDNPTISIGELTYKVNTTLLTGEHLIIDITSKTISKIKNSGEKVNVFDLRDRDADFFEKIPAGMHSVAWSGAFGFDVILLIERSEPEWISSMQITT